VDPSISLCDGDVFEIEGDHGEIAGLLTADPSSPPPFPPPPSPGPPPAPAPPPDSCIQRGDCSPPPPLPPSLPPPSPPAPSPPPPAPPPAPPPPPPPVWALTNLTSTPDDPRATQVEMRFGGSNVDAYTCRLDDQEPAEDCVSPYTLSMLTRGEHTFVVTPVVSAGTTPRSANLVTPPWFVDSRAAG
jgi:hypothetical protein